MEVTSSQAIALLRGQPWPFSAAPHDLPSVIGLIADWAEDGVTLFDGPLQLTGDFRPPSRVTLVTGDLRTDRDFMDGDFDSSLCVVLGDLRALNLITRAELFVTGSVHVGNLLFGSSCSDFRLRVGQDIEADTIIEKGHEMRCSGELKASTVISFDVGFDTRERFHVGRFYGSEAELAKSVLPELLDEEGDVRLDLLVARVRRHQPISKVET